MDIGYILANLVKNPFAPRFYRQLKEYFLSISKKNEAEAVDFLLKTRFGEDVTFDDSDAPQGQRSDDSASTGFDKTS